MFHPQPRSSRCPFHTSAIAQHPLPITLWHSPHWTQLAPIWPIFNTIPFKPFPYQTPPRLYSTLMDLRMMGENGGGGDFVVLGSTGPCDLHQNDYISLTQCHYPFPPHQRPQSFLVVFFLLFLNEDKLFHSPIIN
jgi:hypothetical protein